MNYNGRFGHGKRVAANIVPRNNTSVSKTTLIKIFKTTLKEKYMEENGFILMKLFLTISLSIWFMFQVGLRNA